MNAKKTSSKRLLLGQKAASERGRKPAPSPRPPRGAPPLPVAKLTLLVESAEDGIRNMLCDVLRLTAAADAETQLNARSGIANEFGRVCAELAIMGELLATAKEVEVRS